MNHIKNYHLSKVKHCRNFIADLCSYDERCWFIQDKKQKDSNPIFTFNHCDASFKAKCYLMRHKKTISYSLQYCAYFDICIMCEDCDGEFKRKSDLNVHITMNINLFDILAIDIGLY